MFLEGYPNANVCSSELDVWFAASFLEMPLTDNRNRLLWVGEIIREALFGQYRFYDRELRGG
jgi:hypothetical protein